MHYHLPFRLLFVATFACANLCAQDSKEVMKQLEMESANNDPGYATATFMTTRVVDGQSVETLPVHVLDLRISHRFGRLSSGAYNFFGLDNATMRLGFDYGFTKNIMAGVGHSTFQKTYDAFIKVKLLRQASGTMHMPLTASFVAVMAVNTLKQPDSLKIQFADRVSYVYQLLLARKFSESFALQLMPSLVRQDQVSFDQAEQYVFAMGIGVRQKISKRVNINAEYYYQMPGMKTPGSHNVFSLGVDIHTGGHVFQLHFTNSHGITEKAFITETTGQWAEGDIMFGFNISRVFQLKKK